MYQNRQNILDTVVEHLEMAKRYRDSVWGLCPFHQDTKPSLQVHEDKFRCTACGKWGRTKYLLSVITSSPIKIHQQLTFFNPWTKWLKNKNLNDIAFSSRSTLYKHPSIYMRNRGIDNDTQIILKLGLKEGWIIFPIWDYDGDLLGAVARDTDNNPIAKYVCPNGQNPNLIYVPYWGDLSTRNYVICTFGIIDAISLYVFRVPVFSTTNGKQINLDALDYIRKHIMFWPDKDEEEDAERIAYKLGWRGHVAYHDYPDDSKDPNDMLVKHPDILSKWIEETEKRFK